MALRKGHIQNIESAAKFNKVKFKEIKENSIYRSENISFKRQWRSLFIQGKMKKQCKYPRCKIYFVVKKNNRRQEYCEEHCIKNKRKSKAIFQGVIPKANLLLPLTF